MIHANIDVAIFGGGIAGLWTLARLRQAGYNAWLFESSSLGGVQSIASQGIIHGGTKYALTGKLEKASQAIAAMPGRWRDCLNGTGELDLRAVRVLSEHQYLWSTGSIASDLAGFFAGKLMRARVSSVPRADLQAPFNTPLFKGKLYRLQEPVLDVPDLMRVLLKQVGEYCLSATAAQCAFAGRAITIDTDAGACTITSQAIVLSAGVGNTGLLQQLGKSQPEMQSRPLHMLMVKGSLPALYAHALGPGALPRLTVTSYPLPDEQQVWYLGGQVAEQGVNRNTTEQIAAGKKELATLLPWLQQEGLRWATLRVDRAEPATASHIRPDDCFVESDNGVVTVWPTKLAFAPRVADKVIERLQCIDVVAGQSKDSIAALPKPAIAVPPWQGKRQWN